MNLDLYYLLFLNKQPNNALMSEDTDSFMSIILNLHVHCALSRDSIGLFLAKQ